ncbi:MAG TPA: A/G-specific adenine glycosylase [Lactobacillus sp.]|nr:A/G-specific adenine glycosylase [Lactobacillus sp.]
MEHWSEQTIVAFRQTLLAWYDKNKRDLPWRRDHDPYHVWVSEIMLQQTQVNTVIPYYERFMRTFPTVNDLSAAQPEQLLKAWEGLGYYSRARNLQRAAQEIVEDRHGVWPETAEKLQELTGIGPYTAGAIASIAFGEPVAAVDGNAFRVFGRLLTIDDDITKPATRKLFEATIDKIIDPNRPGDFNQAIMDLGSSYMTAKNPNVEQSPVKEFDQSYKTGHVLDYPVKTAKPRPVPVDYIALVVNTPDGYLMTKRPSNGLLANLWTFPLIKIDDLLKDDEQLSDLMDVDLVQRAQQAFATETEISLSLAPIGGRQVTHTFTHLKWQIQIFSAELKQRPDISLFAGEIVPERAFNEYPMPVVQQKLWQRWLAASTKK